jgi:hypothetical protein
VAAQESHWRTQTDLGAVYPGTRDERALTSGSIMSPGQRACCAEARNAAHAAKCAYMTNRS